MPESEEERKVFERLIDSPADELRSSYEPTYSEIAGYHRDTTDTNAIKSFFRDSFMAYSPNKTTRSQNAERLFKVFEQRRSILSKFDFITHENTLLPKGSLLAELNGYAQIPVIEALFDRKLPMSNLAEFTAGVASLSTVSEAVAYKIERQKEYEASHKKKGGFININIDTKSPEIQITAASYGHNSPELTSFVDGLENYLTGYNETMKRIDPRHEVVAQDKPVVTRLYNWAELNMQSDDAIKNWQALGKAHAKNVDEGGMFNEICRTVNLLKQMGKMAQKASALKEFAEHKGYYETLAKMSKDAIALVQKESIFIHGI